MVNNIDQVEEQCKGDTGKRFQAMGFRPKHPVALFNSLSGNVIEVVESKRMPQWVANQPDGKDGGALWVDVGKVTAAAVGNITGFSNTNTAAARVLRWQEEMINMMDNNADGNVDAEELLSFLTDTVTLKDDQLIQKVKQEAEGKSTLQLLKELGPCMPKIMAALVEAKSKAEKTDEMAKEKLAASDIEYNWEASTEYAKHMQLQGGWQDPDGIKVRARSGLAAMECLVANDPGGLMASLGAALMLPVTSALRDIGYEEGINMRAYGYDWRVPCTKLEEKEEYLSKTMEDITELVATNQGRKAVVVTHSLGGVMASYFFQWVAHSDFGRQHGGVQWLQDHIHAFCPIAGPLLGTPYGSHSYITGDEGQGLAPAVFSYNDRHLVVRSWGMFGMIFPTGRHLMLQPTHSVHWVRRDGCLNIHVQSVTMQGDKIKDNENVFYYVMVGFKEPKTGHECRKQKCTPIKMSTVGAIDEQLMFYWGPHYDKIDDAELTISLWRDWIGPIDKEVARGTFKLNEDKVTIVEGDNPQTFAGCTPNEYVEFNFPLTGKTTKGVDVKVSVRLKFVPFNAQQMHNDFRRPGDDGAYRCGGKADACSSQEKRERLQAVLGPQIGQEWKPISKNKPDVTYEPMDIDQMMVLDGMEPNYNAWKECYADDPVWRQYSTEPPQGVNRIRPVYGINVPTLVGNVYRRKNKKIGRYQPNTSLELDKFDAEVNHPSYDFNGGIVTEMPHKTPQADDPTVPLSQMTFNTKASGDATVAYWSLRWPITWKSQGFDVKVKEVEGADHRNILSTPGCLETVLHEACETPTKYVEIILHSVTYSATTSCMACCFNVCCCCVKCLCDCIGVGQDSVFVGLKWHDLKFTSEPVPGHMFGGERDIDNQRRFVFGVTQQDFDKEEAIIFKIHTAVQSSIAKGAISDGTKAIPVKVSDLIKENKSDGPQVLKMGEDPNAAHKIKYSWRWGAADDAGNAMFGEENH